MRSHFLFQNLMILQLNMSTIYPLLIGFVCCIVWMHYMSFDYCLKMATLLLIIPPNLSSCSSSFTFHTAYQHCMSFSCFFKMATLLHILPLCLPDYYCSYTYWLSLSVCNHRNDNFVFTSVTATWLIIMNSIFNSLSLLLMH